MSNKEEGTISNASAEQEDLRKRGIEFLLKNRIEDKKIYEFTIGEVEDLLQVGKTTAYDRMQELIKSGIWETRMAFDPVTRKQTRVYWMK